MAARAPVIVVVTGPPASGKTTLARQVAGWLSMPLISKDDLKVILYHTLGWGGRERDRLTSDAVYELMYHLAEAEMRAERSVMLESNFRPESADRLLELIGRYRYRAVQIRCIAEREVLVDRLRARVSSSERHPGHADRLTFEGELEALLASGARLSLPGDYLEVNTTIGYEPNLDALKAAMMQLGMGSEAG